MYACIEYPHTVLHPRTHVRRYEGWKYREDATAIIGHRNRVSLTKVLAPERPARTLTLTPTTLERTHRKTKMEGPRYGVVCICPRPKRDVGSRPRHPPRGDVQRPTVLIPLTYCTVHTAPRPRARRMDRRRLVVSSAAGGPRVIGRGVWVELLPRSLSVCHLGRTNRAGPELKRGATRSRRVGTKKCQSGSSTRATRMERPSSRHIRSSGRRAKTTKPGMFRRVGAGQSRRKRRTRGG